METLMYVKLRERKETIGVGGGESVKGWKSKLKLLMEVRNLDRERLCHNKLPIEKITYYLGN